MKKIFSLFITFVVLGLASFSFPVSANDKYTVIARDAVLDGDLQNQLRSSLSAQDYNNFYANLESFSYPYKLKSGATYYEARRDGLDAGSALVIGHGGIFYLAYKTPFLNTITYISNDRNCNTEVHVAIKVFAERFEGKPNIVFSKSTKEKTSSHGCSEVYGNIKNKDRSFLNPDSVNPREATPQQSTRKAAESIWGAAISNSWNMNDELAGVVGQAVNSINTCSAAFSLVPKPPAYGPIPGLLYFAKYASQVILYNSGLQKSVIYRTCLVSTARNFRSAAELASLGI